MHGLIGSAGDFVTTGGARALAFRLHLRCFDVWMPNARGTTLSRKHRTLSADQPAFWAFTWHEIGIFDLPAVLDYVLAITRQRQLHYVGHSQGTTVLLVLLAQRQDYNGRLASVSLMAPVAFLKHLSSPPLNLLASNTLRLLNQLGLHEILPASALTQVGGQFICSATLPTYALCTLFISLCVGFSDYPADRHIFSHVLETTPAGLSLLQLKHFGQLINAGNFQQYDYESPILNIQRYGQTTPPVYQLRNVHVPLLLFYGTRDALASLPDVARLTRELSNSRVTLYQVRGYNHIDFIYASSAPVFVYERIIYNAWALDTGANSQ
ncbi:lipase 3 [Scaptodrosophila lebanonensis]|uniref:Lipase 3 n=1 Tax=Drosophila lebanonensis TaxID=7225 RepID=A0A6J2TFQ5_DROLE|nr:lipase 3 [Scaptodrosophila lebanonensis]